jgi:secreted Zn-dependent insulinase-like peptidase
VGHEGPGSLLGALKHAGYARELVAGIGDDGLNHNTVYTQFAITITLTEVGLANWILAARVVFDYLAMLAREGPRMWVFEEMSALAQVEHDFLEEEDEDEFVDDLSVRMSPLFAVDRRDLLACGELFWEWNPDEVAALQRELVPQKALVELVS